MRKIIIAGGSGLIGSRLANHFSERGDIVVKLSRRAAASSGQVHTIAWNGDSCSEVCEALDETDVLINLCGSPINVPWTESNRTAILESRTETTLALGKIVERLKNKPKYWINASAVGFYGDAGTREVSEAATKGSGFLGDVCSQWETAARTACPSDLPLLIPRIGIVLDKDGGALPELIALARRWLGGQVGTGKQYVSWVHMKDIIRLFDAAIRQHWIGASNFCSPFPVTNSVFMREIRRVCRRPWAPPAPQWLLGLTSRFTGVEPELVLSSQRAVPQIAMSHGFHFDYPHLREALVELTSC